MNAPKRTAPVEPVLDVADIQGAAAPGFFKPFQTLIGLNYPRTDKGVAAFQRVVASVDIADCARTLQDRKAHRADPNLVAPPLIAIGLSYLGLVDLTASATEIASEAFKIGLPGRSALLGDPREGAGSPACWAVGAPGAELDALVIVAGDTRETVDEAARKIENRLVEAGVKSLVQAGGVLPGEMRGHEHFGFDDGVSQPGIRGRVSNSPDDFITERHVAPGQFPAEALYGYPGQDLVWPGEFVIGYPRTSPDPLIPGPIESATPAWTRNGSFLVYRRLAQDVYGFWKAMRAEAARLAQLPGFFGLTDVALAAKLVGRWPSGAPIARAPKADDPKLGAEPLANNHFRFDSDTATLTLVDGTDTFPAAKADPIGAACPLAAHIRKVNTRDAPSDMGGRSATYDRRLLRVGVPFGPPVENRYGDPAPNDPERGLLFLSIQTSIDEQFEFLQARWMNDLARPKAPSGNDMIVGQNAATHDGKRRAVLFGDNLQMAEVTLPQQYVIPTGGGYFFIPSLRALREVIAPRPAETHKPSPARKTRRR
jgi:Dyp-type peroxidase family